MMRLSARRERRVVTNDLKVGDIELSIDDIDLTRAKVIYDQHGALILRGVAREYVARVLAQMKEVLKRALAPLPRRTPIRSIKTHGKHRTARRAMTIPIIRAHKSLTL